MSEHELESVRVLQSANATRGVAADVELSMEPRPKAPTVNQQQGWYLAPVVVRAGSVDGGPFSAPRLVVTGGVDGLTRADWEKLDRTARQLFDEYDRTFGEGAIGQPARLQAPSGADEPHVETSMPGLLLLSEKEVSARSLRPMLDRLLERVGAQKVSVVVTSLEPL